MESYSTGYGYCIPLPKSIHMYRGGVEAEWRQLLKEQLLKEAGPKVRKTWKYTDECEDRVTVTVAVSGYWELRHWDCSTQIDLGSMKPRQTSPGALEEKETLNHHPPPPRRKPHGREFSTFLP